MFLHDFANAIWSLKELEGLHLSISVTFIHQKVSTTLQRMQVYSILSWVVVVGLATSQLPPLQDTPPITTSRPIAGRWFLKWRNMVDLL
jgi:hypothetical protein